MMDLYDSDSIVSEPIASKENLNPSQYHEDFGPRITLLIVGVIVGLVLSAIGTSIVFATRIIPAQMAGLPQPADLQAEYYRGLFQSCYMIGIYEGWPEENVVLACNELTNGAEKNDWYNLENLEYIQ